MNRMLAASVVLLIVGTAIAADQRSTTVGMPAKIDQLVLPGSELVARPSGDRKVPIVLRIANSYPHGTAYRYDLVYYGLDPGDYDLRDYLQRKDGSPVGELPTIAVKVTSVLPAGQVVPHELSTTKTWFFTGYRLIAVTAVLFWCLCLLLILFAKRTPKKALIAEQVHQLTLADRLRPLVERGVAGTLGVEERADLERSLLTYWKKKLDLLDTRPAEAFATLRKHPEAGPLLGQLERWLHRPGPSSDVDVVALLEPYRRLPADALDAGAKA